MPKPKPETPTGTVTARDAVVQQKLETLKKEYADLNTQKITTEANINNLEENLAKLRAAAAKEYGTSDLEELKKILEQRRQENEARVAQYEEHIQTIKTNLAAIAEPPGEGG